MILYVTYYVMYITWDILMITVYYLWIWIMSCCFVEVHPKTKAV